MCSESRFKCRNGRCLDRSFLCNGQDNCQDNSDEELCLTTAGTLLNQTQGFQIPFTFYYWKRNIYPGPGNQTQGHAEAEAEAEADFTT